jgi:hypothetical protein
MWKVCIASFLGSSRSAGRVRTIASEWINVVGLED